MSSIQGTAAQNNSISLQGTVFANQAISIRVRFIFNANTSLTTYNKKVSQMYY